MIIAQKDFSAKCYLIAEAGNNHEGDFQRALDLVDAAAESGAHAIKFQTIYPEKLVSFKETARLAQLKKFELSKDQYIQLKERADSKNIDFLSTPFALDAVEALDPLVPAFKIASGDITWHALIQKVASTGKPVFLSTGGASIDEVKAAISAYEKGKLNYPSQLVVMHCVMAYPAPAENLNLYVISKYKSIFHKVGYSDHYLGIQACIAAAALGANVIEKHFTLNKNTSDFRDHQLSADPKDMKILTTTINEMLPMLGKADKDIQDCEKDILRVARRSPKARHDLKKGHTLTENDILMLRPNSGLDAHTPLIGKVLSENTNKGSDIKIEEI